MLPLRAFGLYVRTVKTVQIARFFVDPEWSSKGKVGRERRRRRSEHVRKVEREGEREEEKT